MILRYGWQQSGAMANTGAGEMGRREDRIEAELEAMAGISKDWMTARKVALRLRCPENWRRVARALQRLESKGVVERTVLETIDGEGKTRLTNHYRANSLPIGMLPSLVKRIL